MEKSIGKEYKNAREREAFLKDNCDKVEEKGYMKPYSTEELQGHKENLANVSIEIAEIEAFILLSPGANQTLEDVRDRAIDEQLEQIKTIAPSIAIIEI